MGKIINLSVRNLTDEELSQVDRDDKTFPQIALTFNDEDNNEIGCEYMYPLRRYFFQIGGLGANGATIQGHGFFKGAANLIKSCRSVGMEDSHIKNIFNSEASSCILEFVRRFTDRSNNSAQRIQFVKEYGEFDLRIDPIIGSMNTIWHKDTVWAKFINYTFEYFDNQLTEEIGKHSKYSVRADKL